MKKLINLLICFCLFLVHKNSQLFPSKDCLFSKLSLEKKQFSKPDAEKTRDILGTTFSAFITLYILEMFANFIIYGL